MATEVPVLGTDHQGQFTLTPEQLQQYFVRIGYETTTPVPPPTIQTLWDLHSLQATTIPFENLSLVHHKLKTEAYPPISLHIESLFHKLVAKRRGGYCYELNTLFAAVLRTCGFVLYVGGAMVVLPLEGADAAAADPLANRMMDNHSHMFLNVMMEDGARWLADVGFGKRGPVYPVRIKEEPDAAPTDAPYTSVSNFRLRRGVPFRKEGGNSSIADRMPHRHGWYLQTRVDAGWLDNYFFDTSELLFGDMQFGSHYISTVPSSIWLNWLLVTRPTLRGRQTLLNFRLTADEDGTVVLDKELAGEEERDAVLNEMFGIDVDGGKV